LVDVTFSVFTALTAASRTVIELAIWRGVVGIGLGGEWAGAVLVSETWLARHRAKIIADAVRVYSLRQPAARSEACSIHRLPKRRGGLDGRGIERGAEGGRKLRLGGGAASGFRLPKLLGVRSPPGVAKRESL
jgi:hypothetical protein